MDPKKSEKGFTVHGGRICIEYLIPFENANLVVVFRQAFETVFVSLLRYFLLSQVAEWPLLEVLRVRILHISAYLGASIALVPSYDPQRMNRGDTAMTDWSYATIVFKIKFLVATSTSLTTCLIYVPEREKYRKRY